MDLLGSSMSNLIWPDYIKNIDTSYCTVSKLIAWICDSLSIKTTGEDMTKVYFYDKMLITTCYQKKCPSQFLIILDGKRYM